MKKLFLTFLVAILMIPQVSFAALSDNLKAYWKLDESSGDATDVHAANTLVNTSTTYVSAKIKNGARFSSSKLVNTTFSAPPGSGDFSTSMWFRANGAPPAGLGVLLSIGVDSTTGGFIIYRYPGGSPATNAIKASGGSFSGQVVGPVMTNGDGVMHHLAVVYDGAYINLYFDGAFYAQTAKTDFNITSDNFTLGQLDTSAYYANDDIDELGMWTRALTSDEVAELYNSGDGLAYDDLVAPSSVEDITWFFF